MTFYEVDLVDAKAMNDIFTKVPHRRDTTTECASRDNIELLIHAFA